MNYFFLRAFQSIIHVPRMSHARMAQFAPFFILHGLFIHVASLSPGGFSVVILASLISSVSICHDQEETNRNHDHEETIRKSNILDHDKRIRDLEETNRHLLAALFLLSLPIYFLIIRQLYAMIINKGTQDEG